jgi:hypothetical protein
MLLENNRFSLLESCGTLCGQNAEFLNATADGTCSVMLQPLLLVACCLDLFGSPSGTLVARPNFPIQSHSFVKWNFVFLQLAVLFYDRCTDVSKAGRLLHLALFHLQFYCPLVCT